MNKKTNIVIIGAGSAGIAALRQVQNITDDYLLIDQGPLGTTCARTGCMPSKAFIRIAHDIDRAAHEYNQTADETSRPAVHIPAVLKQVRASRDAFTNGMIEATRERARDHLIEGHATFVSPHHIQVNDQIIHADRFIIATGAQPIVPSAWRDFGKRVLTSESLFEQTDLPHRMAVIGLGAIGLELSQALSRLGVAVTGFDALDTLGGLSDPEVNATLFSRINKEFPIHVGQKAEVEANNRALIVKAGETHVTVDRVLVAMGVRPNLDGLRLEKLGAELDAQGQPTVNPRTAQIADLPVYMAGDANGDRPLLHEALDEGFIAGRNAFATSPDCHLRRTGLRIVFSDPQTAVVGQSQAELSDHSIVTGTVNFKQQSRAIIDHQPYGILKLYADAESGCLLGSEMACPAAEHLAHLLALAIQHNMTVFDLLRMPFYHPTLEEGLRSALREAARQLPQAQDLTELRYGETCPEPPLC